MQHCPNCGWPIEPGNKFCRNCGKPFEDKIGETPPPPPAPPVPPDSLLPPPPPDEPKYVAWEDRQRLGFFEALWKTWVESVFYPDKFFSKLPFTGGMGSPLLYALIIAWTGSIVSSIYQAIFSSFWLNLVRNYIDRPNLPFNLPFVGQGFGLLIFIRSVFIAPVAIILGLFVISGIYHLICMVFGWSKRDFEATFRAVTYSAGPAIFAIIPMCGSPIGTVWMLVLAIIGIKNMQQTTGGKATVVVLLPLLFCCCLIILGALIFGTAIWALIQGATHSGYNY